MNILDQPPTDAVNLSISIPGPTEHKIPIDTIEGLCRSNLGHPIRVLARLIEQAQDAPETITDTDIAGAMDALSRIRSCTVGVSGRRFGRLLGFDKWGFEVESTESTISFQEAHDYDFTKRDVEIWGSG